MSFSLIAWGIFYLITGSVLSYYLFFKGNLIEKKVNWLRESFVKKVTNLNISWEDQLKSVATFFFNLVEALIVVLFIQQFYFGHFKVPTGSMIPHIIPGDHYVVNMLQHKFLGFKRGRTYVFKQPKTDIMFCKRMVALPGEIVKIGFDGKLYINDEAVNLPATYISNMNAKPSLIMHREWTVPKKGDEVSLDFAVFSIEDKDGVSMVDLDRMKKMYEKDKKVLNKIIHVEMAQLTLNDTFETGIILDDEVLGKLILQDKAKLEEDYFFFLGDNTQGSNDSRYWGFAAKSKIKGSLLLRIWPLDRVGIAY